MRKIDSNKINKDDLENKKRFSFKILDDITSGRINSIRDIELKQFDYSKEFNLSSVPSRSFIFSCSKNPSNKVKELLSIKPVRSISGVQVIAVMLPSFKCPGECVYCPSSFEKKHSPKSYTGFEPSAMRAERLGYDPYKIVSNRIQQLDSIGHNPEKIELIFQGSSFTSLSKKKQEIIVGKSISAVLEKPFVNEFEKLKLVAEKSNRRLIGITFETRPDLCDKKDVEQLLYLGGTRVELGVQNPDDKIYEKINRGHDVNDVINSTEKLKDSAFKVLYHLMPGLPGSSFKNDLKNFRKIFSSPEFRPDMVKFYPCLVIKGTELYEDWKKGNFTPMDEKKAIKLISRLKEEIPPWVRIMRVNRDIPSNIIEAGVKKTNLRQMIHEQMDKDNKKCNCIRCKEIGFSKNPDKEKPKLLVRNYSASKGEEYFISMESKNHLFGFTRLRFPHSPFIKTINEKTALIRELHVYGKALSLKEKSNNKSEQHKGYGKILLEKAEEIALENDKNKLSVISGLGVREYYKKKGYKKEEPYMSKTLKK